MNTSLKKINKQIKQNKKEKGPNKLHDPFESVWKLMSNEEQFKLAELTLLTQVQMGDIMVVVNKDRIDKMDNFKREMTFKYHERTRQNNEMFLLNKRILFNE